ncbi:1-aminocyclopropane-1-carboxylate oxidase homolog 1-like [Phoenix dactylifera]|uniref:1-aminocyclopropane-1-carboxylate oxidase homolog 1-like n=1 Tax=Phoenix dactylifera TaxID=42345 RepID=A0A8B7BK54_PHODC|nr:1-aminocyclopropane-1-carboxylate oxidase homolog 1-like [Phoenix dactylifera]
MSIDYDRAGAMKAFDETKAGVKGLVDAGIRKIPPFFFRPPDHLDGINPSNSDGATARLQIPVIDLRGSDSDSARRKEVVAEVRRASETLGFFQVVNHGVPAPVLDEMLAGVRTFNEAAAEVKREYYTRDPAKKVRFNSNFDLYQAPAANWRDSLSCAMAPEPPRPDELPLACREITLQYANHIQKVGIFLFELLSEALGLNRDHLNEMECAKGLGVVAHYYPPCPEPHLTLGISKHSDPDFLTILLQDQIGGLQVVHQNQWIDVPPLPGALIVNIGDLLQLISNDRLKSVEHRVLANKSVDPRISVACFFSTHFYPSTKLYGPIKELLSNERPMYKEVSAKEYVTYYKSKGLDGQSALNYFKI